MYALMDDMHMAYATEVFMFDSIVDDPSYGFKVSNHPFYIVLIKYQLLIEVYGIQHRGHISWQRLCRAVV